MTLKRTQMTLSPFQPFHASLNALIATSRGVMLNSTLFMPTQFTILVTDPVLCNAPVTLISVALARYSFCIHSCFSPVVSLLVCELALFYLSASLPSSRTKPYLFEPFRARLIKLYIAVVKIKWDFNAHGLCQANLRRVRDHNGKKNLHSCRIGKH